MNDEHDDRCADEGREADIADRHADGCRESFGVGYDPYDDGEEADNE
jgi:hypothetical protein